MGKRVAFGFLNFVVAFVVCAHSLCAMGEDYKGQSLYQLDGVWETDSGSEVRLADFEKSYVVLTLAYTRCSSACPLMVERLRKIEQELKSAKAPAVHFVIISLDPDSDSVAALAHFRKQRKIEGSNWHLLRGTRDQLRRFSVMIGYSFRSEGDSGEIMHSNKILLLSPQGVPLITLDGLTSDITPLTQAVISR